MNIITNGRGAISCHGNSKACTHVPFNKFRGVPERGACHAIQLMAQCLWMATPNMNTSIQVFCIASQYYVHVPCGHVNCAIQLSVYALHRHVHIQTNVCTMGSGARMSAASSLPVH